MTQIKSFGKKRSLTEQEKITEAREKLQARIDLCNLKAESYLGTHQIDELVYMKPSCTDVGLVDEEDGNVLMDEDIDDEEAVTIGPECSHLCLPSSLGLTECKRIEWNTLASQEVELRKGQANEALEILRMALGHKALLLRKLVRNSKSQKQSTRAWGEVKKVTSMIYMHVRTYKMAREALIQLLDDRQATEILSVYQEISAGDLKMSGDIVEENRIGQRRDTLPWIWRLGNNQNTDQNIHWMEECEFSINYGDHI